MASTRYRTIESPIGPLTLAGDDQLTHICTHNQAHTPASRDAWLRAPTAFGDAVAQLRDYFAGSLQVFDLDIRLDGTEFQRRVWAALLEIPYGETRSYGQIATRIGQPTACRAVGLANGRNPISIVVPCHRVIGASGALVGYGGGVPNKRALLDLERGVLSGDAARAS